VNLTEWFSFDPIGAGIVIGIIVFVALTFLAGIVIYLANRSE